MKLLKRRKIQFTDKTHPFWGIVSVITGSLCMIACLALFIGSGRARGNAGILYGYLGVLNMFVTVIGLICALRCFRKEDIYYVTPIVGTALNGILTLNYIILCFVGIL